MRSLSFMGTSMMPLTGGLLPLENLTRVTSPGSSANSAWTAAAESAMTALGKEKEEFIIRMRFYIILKYFI